MRQPRRHSCGGTMHPTKLDDGSTRFACDQCTGVEYEQPTNVELHLAEMRARLADAKTVRV